MLAGEEPLTSQATHALGLILNKLIKGVNCSIGAEASNVKDEPRAERARRVQHDDSGAELSFRRFVR